MTVTTSALRKALERSTNLQFEDDSLLVAPNGVELEKYAGCRIHMKRGINLICKKDLPLDLPVTFTRGAAQTCCLSLQSKCHR